MEHSQFGNWYALFKGLTPKTRVLKAPEAFRQYLLSDGIRVPDDDNSDSDSETSAVKNANEETDEEDDTEPPILPPKDFHDQIETTIAELGGTITPKLNWSAPRDATWISPTGDMRCINANDVYMLIKSSDYCTHDLNQNPSELSLILREWFDIVPSMEFRCFIRNRKLVAISQRDINYYEFLAPLQPKIEALLSKLASTLVEKYPDSSFVFDAYVPRNLNKAWLIDINPWLEITDSLLFGWDELENWDGPFEFRLVERQDASRTFSSKPHSTNHVPHDLVDMPESDLQDLVRQMKEAKVAQEEASTN